MKKIGVGLLIVLGIIAFWDTALGESQIKIGYVNLQMALNRSIAGEEAKEIFEQEKIEKQEEITSKEKEFKRHEEDLQKKKAILKKEAIEAKKKDLEKKKEEFQQFFLKAEEDLRRREAQLTREIIRDLEVIVKDLAKEKGYTFVFERMEGGIIYAPEGEDLTDEVIKIYDEAYSKRKEQKDLSVPTR